MADVNRDNTSMRGGTSKACHTVRQGFKYELFEKQAPFSFPETSRRYFFCDRTNHKDAKYICCLVFSLAFLSVYVDSSLCRLWKTASAKLDLYPERVITVRSTVLTHVTFIYILKTLMHAFAWFFQYKEFFCKIICRLLLGLHVITHVSRVSIKDNHCIRYSAKKAIQSFMLEEVVIFVVTPKLL